MQLIGESGRLIVKKLMAMVLLALALGAGLATTFVVNPSLATSGGAPAPKCNDKC
jgi:hypothetical protein